MINVAILGAGKIGSAVYRILQNTRVYPYTNVNHFIIDANLSSVELLGHNVNYEIVDFAGADIREISQLLKDRNTTHVINALPFFLNEKVASASVAANCNYIDFTEDDMMADIVKEIYRNSGLFCAVKCGLAPGFINYIGYDLVNSIDIPESLIISVGALPRTVSFSEENPEHSYNLSWSVDGLVNEYIRPCRIKKNNIIKEVPSLGDLQTVIIDGFKYEAALTSGGVGSLIHDLVNVPNIQYMTLRYPGHYKYVKETVGKHDHSFDKIKSEFISVFPNTDDDVIVVYATATGKTSSGNYIRRSYSNKFYGIDGLSGIQSTTAGSGVAVLEMILKTNANWGILDHKDIPLHYFTDTYAFKKYYNTNK